MRKSLAYLGILLLILPLLFVGCSGDDGATGAAGPPGDAGAPGPPGTGVLANESCVVCHATGRIADVAAVHDTATGTATAVITGAEFNPAGDNVSLTFTFAAQDVQGNPVPVDLTAAPSTGTNLTHLRFTIARLVPGQVYDISTRDPDSWDFYGPRSHRNKNQLEQIAADTYRFTFVEGIALDTAQEGFTHRVGIEIYALPSGLQSVNPTFDWVPDGVTPLRSREIVTTAACNECHNPLGYTPSFHGSRRVDTKYCVLCHNPNNDLAPQSADAGAPSVPIPFVKAIHGVHNGKDLLVFEDGVNHGDFTEVTYPQDIRNCTKCHQGGADSDNWKARPSREACGTCHDQVDFDTGAGHLGGAQANNRLCAACHSEAGITTAHLTEDATPNNSGLPAGLANFEYFIDNVAVDGAGVASVTFRIEKDGAPLDLSTYPPAGLTGGPSFLLAWALPQDGISAPADYNNLNSPAPPSSSNGNGAGDAPSVSLANVAGSLTLLDDATKQYQASLTSRPFPADATMRAVGIQSYFSQVVGTGTIARHTPSVVMAVPGDAVRRQVVKSGYDAVTGQPFGCLECHESLQLHGGSRVNNVQVCVMCHNPNKSSSGRTVDPANINPDVVAALGSDPLTYPEATNNFKNMIHGIHAATDRPYEFVRNRASGFYYNWSHVTFPGDLRNCTKCHIGDSYMPEALPAGVLFNVARTTTGNSAETRADIIAARSSVPNSTDQVDSPIAGACYYCHDSALVKSHIVANGGKIGSEREDAILAFTP